MRIKKNKYRHRADTEGAVEFKPYFNNYRPSKGRIVVFIACFGVGFTLYVIYPTIPHHARWDGGTVI